MTGTRSNFFGITSWIVFLAIATTASAQQMPGPSAPPGAMATAPQPAMGQDPVLNGFQLYQQANYIGAAAAFQSAVQAKPHDTLAKVWLGLSQVASGDDKAGIFTLQYATDSIGPWSDAAAELRALTYWRQGAISDAKSELGYCMHGKSAALCAKMRQGIDSGQQPPDVSAWPGIVGMVAATQARGTTWTP